MNQIIFNFLCKYLTSINVSFFITDSTSVTMKDFDLGLRNTILKNQIEETVSSMYSYDDKTLYHFTDFYKCCYSFFRLPDKRFIFIGPYLFKDVTEARIKELMCSTDNRNIPLSQLEDYYHGLPLMSDKHTFLEFLCHSYCEICNISEPTVNYFDLYTLESCEAYLKKHEFIALDDPTLSMNLLEKRYHMEDLLLDAIAQGNSTKAMTILNQSGTFKFNSRVNDEQRNKKNLILSLNTLLRRSAYTAGVHPFYIDVVSANYVRLIENATSLQELEDIIPFLIRSYCNLVKQRSTAHYSEPIRQILVTVDASLSSDLSLKRFSNELFLNTSYLSSLFKKETGMTLTDYVNKNRIDHAKRLLKSTTLSIQSVGATVGIPDIHYFTRLFRRATGYSPREFRKI